MTRQEAVELLKPFRDCMTDQYGCPISDVVFALDVAIKALEQEPSEDCISREWVLKKFQKGKEKIYKSEYFDELMWLVKHAPNVVPKERIEK